MEISLEQRGRYKSRILNVSSEGKSFLTPAYFASISSAASKQPFESLIGTYLGIGYKRLLISAYDLGRHDKRAEISTELGQYMKKSFLILDSGGFEKYWRGDNKWDYSNYEKALNAIPSDIYVGYDEIPNSESTEQDIKSSVLEFTKKSSSLIQKGRFMAIAHGKSPDHLISNVKEITEIYKGAPTMISVTERECGITMKDKIRTIIKIRDILDKADPTSYLHILGCGSPISIALFSYAGADGFDSTDWSRRIVDPKYLRYLDQFHLPLIGCNCQICETASSSPHINTAIHNLLFYESFMDGLRKNIKRNIGLEFLKWYIDPNQVSDIAKLLTSQSGAADHDV